MPIEPRSFPDIVSDLRAKVATSFPELDTSEGTFFRLATIDPFSLELEQVESLLLEVQESQSLLTATGSDLDLLAFNYNVYRRGAQKASGFVQFYAPQSGFTDPISIPKNIVVTSLDGGTYTTLLDGVLNGFSQQSTRNSVAVYEITLPVSAEIVGVGGNAVAQSIVSTTIDGLNVTNDSAIEGGFNEETDDSLAARAIQSFGIWSRGVPSAVEAGARLVPGVYYASAVYAYAGHFYIYISDQAGNLSDEMKTAVDTILNDWAAAGVGWTVLQPPLFLQNVTIKVAFKTIGNSTTQQNQVKTDVATVINASKSHKIYWETLINDIRTKLSSYVSHFEIDVPDTHILKTEGTIIRCGVVTVVDVSGTI